MQFLFESAREVDVLYYTAAAPGGGSETCSLPLVVVTATGLPPGLRGVLFASDLQGVAPLPSAGGELALLGEVLVHRYASVADSGAVPPAASVGVVLAGDLFSEERGRKRGATGDVGSVWAAFASQFAWVAGVAGNHDLFTSRTSRRVLRDPNVALLDGDAVEFDGLKIGGIGGVIGPRAKPNRRSVASFANAVCTATCGRPDVVVMHEGPPGVGRAQRGRAEVGAALTKVHAPLVVCGHVHWAEPWASLGDTVVLNVDARAVLVVPPS